MANKNDSQQSLVNPAVSDFEKELAALEGLDASGASKTGGLTPIYNSKLAFEKKWPALVGKLDRLERLPIDDDKPRLALVVRDVKLATFGTTGPKTRQTLVAVPKGETIMIGLSGNLKSNRDLFAALQDVQHVYDVAFKVTGQMPIEGQSSDMWVIDCRIWLKTPHKREGLYALPAGYVSALARGDIEAMIKGVFPQTSSGESYDPKTGEVVNAPRAQASA